MERQHGEQRKAWNRVVFPTLIGLMPFKVSFFHSNEIPAHRTPSIKRARNNEAKQTQLIMSVRGVDKSVIIQISVTRCGNLFDYIRELPMQSKLA